MARISYVDPQSASPRVGEIFAALPAPLNIFRLLAHAETAFEPFIRFAGTVLGALELDPRLRELAIIHVAQLSGAEYEWIQHEAIARAVGVSDEQIDAVRSGDLAAECFSDAERAVLGFTTESVRDVRVSDTTFTSAARHLSERELVELVLTIGAYMTVARVMEAFSIDLEPAIGGTLVENALRARIPRPD